MSGGPVPGAGGATADGAPRRRLLFHIRQFGVGGVENALMGWLRTVDRSRFDVGLAISLPTREFEQMYRPRLPPDVRVHVLLPAGRVAALMQQRRDHRLGTLGRLGLGVAMSTWAPRRVLRALRDLAPGYDVLIDFDLMLRKLAQRVPLPTIGVRHFRFWDRRSGKAKRVGRDLARYGVVGVLNASMAAQARALYGDSVRLAVLPNTFDLAAIRQAARAEAQTPLPEVGYVVCVARLEARTKGHDVLLRAWAALRERQPGRREALVLVGDGPDREALQRQAQALGLDESAVRFVGLQANPYRWIGGARALVLASRSEGQPNVLIEAMALGCLAISTDCPVGPADLLAEGAGLLVPVDDVQGLADAMARALDDAALAESCRARALARAEDYGAPAGNARLSRLVESLLSADGLRAPLA